MKRGKSGMKSRPFLAGCVVSVIAAASASAESICRADVSYQWKRGKEETAAAVQISRIEARGKDDAAAKAKLAEAAAREKPRALEACRKDHENQAGCVAGKFDLYGVSLKSLSFSARKKLEEAIQADCTAAQGACVDAITSEPQCAVIEDPAAAEAAGKDKKDGKGKKK